MARSPLQITLAARAKKNPQFFNPIKPIVGAAKAVGKEVSSVAHAATHLGPPGPQGPQKRDLSTPAKRAAWAEADRIARKNGRPRSHP